MEQKPELEDNEELLDEGKVKSVNGHRVWVNPSYVSVRNLIKKTMHSRLRLSIDKSNGDLYMWDAGDMTHGQFQNMSGWTLLDMELTNGRGGVTLQQSGDEYQFTVDYSPARFLKSLLPKSNSRLKKIVDKLGIKT